MFRPSQFLKGEEMKIRERMHKSLLELARKIKSGTAPGSILWTIRSLKREDILTLEAMIDKQQSTNQETK